MTAYLAYAASSVHKYATMWINQNGMQDSCVSFTRWDDYEKQVQLCCLFPFPVVPLPKGKEKSKSHKFLCLRVGRAMRKTFVSHASASMLQYAQRDRKHEYWFAVPSERSVLFPVWLHSTLNVTFLFCQNGIIYWFTAPDPGVGCFLKHAVKVDDGWARIFVLPHVFQPA